MRPQLCLLSGLPGTRPPGATADHSQGLRASPARQAWSHPEVRVYRGAGPGPGREGPSLIAPRAPVSPHPHPRKPRGDAKKCRKVYGMERRDLWCRACRWKKACRRFLD